MIRDSKLKELLCYAKKNVGFYREGNYFSQSDVDKNDVLDVLMQIPVTTKADIKSGYQNYISDAILGEDTRFLFTTDFDFKKPHKYTLKSGTVITLEFTSGSSGTPLMIVKTLNERLKLGHIIWKLRNTVSPVRPTELFDFSHCYNESNGYPFPFAELQDEMERVKKELNFLENSSYKWWHMNTYDIEFYYNYINRHGLAFNKNDALTVIENNGSYLSEEDKTRYSQHFSCKIVDHYGCSETWMVALDCQCGNLHVNEENIHLELVDESGNFIRESNKVGKIVLTSLNQFVMPFIRYRLDDLAYFVDESCQCGSNKRRIVLLPGKERIIGTKLYGHRYFKDIVCYLNSNYKITKFHSINVIQTSTHNFEVNVKGNQENRGELERCFIESSKLFFNRDDYNYSFTYRDDLKSEDLFSVATL